MIEITVKLDTTRVEEAIEKAWQNEFLPPDYNTKGGSGWNIVIHQVRDHIAGLDLSEAIARAAKAKLDDVVSEAVTVALRDLAKQRAREMMRDGTLLGKSSS